MEESMAQHEPSLEQIRAALKKLGWNEPHACENNTGTEVTTYTNKSDSMLLLVSAKNDTRTYRLMPTRLEDLFVS
jgi:hypothetical protein